VLNPTFKDKYMRCEEFGEVLDEVK